MVTDVREHTFARARKRWSPWFADLKDRLAWLVLDEPVGHIVAMLTSRPPGSFHVHAEDLPLRFSFVTGFGTRWTYRASEDVALREAIRDVLIAALERAPVSPAGRAILDRTICDWATSDAHPKKNI